MEPAILGVVLDSSVVIEAERHRLDVTNFLKNIAARIGERPAALCSISVAELAHGIHRANTAERRQIRRAFLDDLKAAVPCIQLPPTRRRLLAGSTRNRHKKAWSSLSTIFSLAPVLWNKGSRSPLSICGISRKSRAYG